MAAEAAAPDTAAIGGYRPQLDGLRAIAATGVLYSHFWELDSLPGEAGVRLFFVLSGFLITGILIDMRRGHGAFRTRPADWGRFFARRALRLWPAYYLLLIVALVVNVADIRATGWWHALYLTNILFALRHAFEPWVVAHWWTLAIEQQFYLLWPFAILLPPRRALVAVAIATVALAIVWNAAMTARNPDSYANFLLLPAALDALGGGALLAIANRNGGALVPRWLVALNIVAVPFALWLVWRQWFDWQLAVVSVAPMMLAVALANRGIGGWVGRLLSFGPLVALGRISYGVYLYHLFVLAALFDLMPGSVWLDDRGPLVFAVASTATIAVAWLSWHLVEAPAQRLKRYLPSGREKRRSGAP